MKQTKLLHTQEAFIMGSITQRTETVKYVIGSYKDHKICILMILYPNINIIYRCNLH